MMNPDLKYLYPITRVSSIVNQLRTTAHSAFLVVTPVAVDKVQEKPQMMARHTPQLYSRRSYREQLMSTDSGTCNYNTIAGERYYRTLYECTCTAGILFEKLRKNNRHTTLLHVYMPVNQVALRCFALPCLVRFVPASCATSVAQLVEHSV